MMQSIELYEKSMQLHHVEGFGVGGTLQGHVDNAIATVASIKSHIDINRTKVLKDELAWSKSFELFGEEDEHNEEPEEDLGVDVV